MMINLLPDSFSLKTAWRDARSQYQSLLLYCTGIIAGVAALVAILSFQNDVLLTVDEQAKELLGADLEVRSSQPFNDEIIQTIDSLGGRQSTSIEFASMVLYGTAQEARLSQIRAFEGVFPFYGELKTDPAEAAYHYQESGTALVERSIMTQLGLHTGDSIRVGGHTLEISGQLLEVPGESAVFSLIGPRIFVPKYIIEESDLLQRGSQVEYKSWLQFEPERDIDALISDFRPIASENQVRFSTVESRKERFESIVENLSQFLGIIAFIALLLGGLGVASAIYVYVKRKSSTIATLRCLGVSSRQTLSIFVTQVAVLGLIGALIGSLLGLVAQQFLPTVFASFLPFEIVQQISLSALLIGLLTGICISFGFALLPLISINNIPPLLTLRNIDFSPFDQLDSKTKFGGLALTILIVSFTLSLLLDSFITGFIFTLGLCISILLLLGTSNLLIKLIKSLRLRSMPYIWRQGISNLFRPNNQTTVLVTTLGMGMLLIGVLYLSQEMILERISFQTGDEQPNLVFYDIQSDQNDSILDLASEHQARVLQNVPIVTMRLSEWNGRPVQEVREDTTLRVRRWALTREYRVTYRDHLTETESLIEGEWVERAEGIESIVPISIETEIAEDLSLSLGDSLTFDVQGVPVKTVVSSIRIVDFQQPQPNFFILFPTGVLEPAPQFYATLLHTSDPEMSAGLQQRVVQQHPNVSALDIGLILESVEQFLDKVAMAIQFMALFSIFTGLIVLASSLAISKYQRIREAVLLRTIGALKAQINGIQWVEYLLLGTLSCLTGLILAHIASWLLAWYYFDLIFTPDIPALLITSLLVILMTLIIGTLNMRGVLQKKPLEILRMGSN